jgi:hypothetical protein
MFKGKSHLGNFSDKMKELDYNVGRIMDAIRAQAPDTIVVFTADNGAWQDAWPDAGVSQYRGEKGTAYEAGWRVPGIMWAPGKIPGGGRVPRNDVAHGRMADDRRDGRPHSAPARLGRQRRQAHLFRRHRQQVRGAKVVAV